MGDFRSRKNRQAANHRISDTDATHGDIAPNHSEKARSIPTQQDYENIAIDFLKKLKKFNPVSFNADSLISLVENDPEFLRVFIEQLSQLGDNTITNLFASVVANQLTINDALKDVLISSIGTIDDSGKAVIYTLLMGMEQFDSDLQNYIIEDVLW